MWSGGYDVLEKANGRKVRFDEEGQCLYLVDEVKVFVHIVCLGDSVAEIAGDTIDRVFWIESEGRMQRLWGQPSLRVSSEQSPIHVICDCVKVSQKGVRKCVGIF